MTCRRHVEFTVEVEVDGFEVDQGDGFHFHPARGVTYRLVTARCGSADTCTGPLSFLCHRLRDRIVKVDGNGRYSA